ncbi:hypothetical protein D3C78_929870 [compost metagenome]
MAGNDDGNGVGAIGRAHGAHRLRVADAFGQLAVAGGAAVGDFQQRLPDFLLEGRAARREKQVEALQAAFEVAVQLSAMLVELASGRLPVGVRVSAPLAIHVEHLQAGLVASQQQLAGGAFVVAEIHLHSSSA